MISTHALTWSATIQKTLAVGLASDFNSRTHVECDRIANAIDEVRDISTHALTWSATSSHIGSCAFLCGFQLTHSRGVRLVWLDVAVLIIVFQLTHSRGVRPTSPDSLHSPKNFNSRTHVECDPWLLDLPICIKISTHALTWSATVRHIAHQCAFINFNSRTHVECDGAPRPPIKMPVYFNSRTHVECDRDGATPAADCTKISTHALTWSATARD